MERGKTDDLGSIREFVEETIAEARVREADVTGGKVPFGSDKHIADLEKRIRELVPWRDRQRKGSETRANYSRIINKLKGELASAKRQAEKAKLKSGE